MSALERGVTPGNRSGATTYSFHQPTLMPTYLIAIASGDLTSRDVGPRSKVWCEAEMIDAAAKEFEASWFYAILNTQEIQFVHNSLRFFFFFGFLH